MKSTLITMTLLLAATAANAQTIKPHPLTPVPIQQVTIDDPFWSPKIETWRTVTVNDCFTKFENDHGGAINNFDRVRDGKSGGHAGPAWYDGLIYEMIRASADFLASKPDPALEHRIDGYIDRIAAAQHPDGYLNTWTDLMEPGKRWGLNGGNDVLQHDIYNAGCLIEAAAHYYRATGKVALLTVAVREADCMCDAIGPSPKHNVVPGHAMAEEALVSLYQLLHEKPELKNRLGVDDERRYLGLSEFFIEQRGHFDGRTSFGEYDQDHMSVFEQPTIEGHAVRATLLGVGVSAAAAVNKRPEYYKAAVRLWDNMVDRKLYITGGVGATSAGEAFGPDYDLPNTGYLETCAAVGGAFYSRNLNLALGDARFVDEFETALFNAALGGVSEAGNTYAYVNPLSFDRGHARWSWHDCPCCPPMFLKLMSSLPGDIYAQDHNGVYVNLYISSRAAIAGHHVTLRQTTQYPWQGHVRIDVTPAHTSTFDLCLRVPSWCMGENALYHSDTRVPDDAFTVKVNGVAVNNLEVTRGYARIRRSWKKGDVVDVNMDMPVRRVRAPKVPADRGLVAIQRGPVVYAIESTDHARFIDGVYLPANAPLTSEFHKNLLGGVEVIKAGLRVKSSDSAPSTPVDMEAIPYFAYLNRGPADLRVWIPETEAAAVAPSLAQTATPSASHCWQDDTLANLGDADTPTSSSDRSKPRLSWWDHKGTAEWVQYEFSQPVTIAKSRVFWFADRPVNGGCDLPQSWRLLYRDGTEWRAVPNPSAYDIAADRFNDVSFDPVTTTALRMEVQLKPEWSAGIVRWEPTGVRTFSAK